MLQDNTMTEQVLTVNDACRELQIDRTTLYRWMGKGKIAYVRILGRRGFALSEVQRIKTDSTKK